MAEKLDPSDLSKRCIFLVLIPRTLAMDWMSLLPVPKMAGRISSIVSVMGVLEFPTFLRRRSKYFFKNGWRKERDPFSGLLARGPLKDLSKSEVLPILLQCLGVSWHLYTYLHP